MYLLGLIIKSSPTDQDLKTFLLVEPTVLRGPDPFRMLQAHVVPLYKQRHNLVNFAQGDLERCQQGDSGTSESKDASYILADACPGATPKH